MERDERMGYLVLFSAMLAARKHGLPVGQICLRAPLSGRALRLSEMMTAEPTASVPADDSSIKIVSS
jgi:hypothetical protein